MTRSDFLEAFQDFKSQLKRYQQMAAVFSEPRSSSGLKYEFIYLFCLTCLMIISAIVAVVCSISHFLLIYFKNINFIKIAVFHNRRESWNLSSPTSSERMPRGQPKHAESSNDADVIVWCSDKSWSLSDIPDIKQTWSLFQHPKIHFQNDRKVLQTFSHSKKLFPHQVWYKLWASELSDRRRE